MKQCDEIAASMLPPIEAQLLAAHHPREIDRLRTLWQRTKDAIYEPLFQIEMRMPIPPMVFPRRDP